MKKYLNFDVRLSGLAAEFGPDRCWPWPLRLVGGYGRTYWRGLSSRLAHRCAYETLVGPIPEGLVLDHLCRNRACVNPAHLEPVTNGENLRRGDTFQGINARKTHCIHGHPFDDANTYRRKNGYRLCRTCGRNRAVARKEGVRS